MQLSFVTVIILEFFIFTFDFEVLKIWYLTSENAFSYHMWIKLKAESEIRILERRKKQVFLL